MEEPLVEYDSTVDVLDIWYQHPATVEHSRAEHREGVIVRRNDDTGEVIGVTVLNLSNRDSIEGISLPATP